MSIKPPGRSRERIIVFGTPGTGKTKGYFDIASRLPRTSTVFIIETDYTVDEFIESYSELSVREEWLDNQLDQSAEEYCDSNGTIVVYRVRDWLGFRGAMQRAWERAERDDWIVIDNLSKPWSWVQNWYVETVYGKDFDTFILETRQQQLRKGEGNHTAMEGMFHDWTAINPQYHGVVSKRLMSPPCHLYITATQKKIDDKQMLKDKAAKAIYGGVGLMPDAQKGLGHDGRSLLMFEKKIQYGEESYMVTALKDREREKCMEMEWGDFVDDYLIGMGGWRDEDESVVQPKIVKKGMVKK